MTGLRHLIDDGTVDPAEIICVLGKTEGNGCVNDWSRGFATVAYATLIAERLSDGDGGVSLTVRMGEAVEGIARACDRNPLTGSAPTWTDGTQAEYGVAKAAEVTLKARSRDHGHAAATRSPHSAADRTGRSRQGRSSTFGAEIRAARDLRLDSSMVTDTLPPH